MSEPTLPGAGNGAVADAPADLLPATGNFPAQSVRYQTVVLTDIPGGSESDLRDLDEPVDLADDGLEAYHRPGQGMIITTEQTWTGKGVTLGRLLHSLALAPGESTRLAVVEWERRTRGASQENVDQAEKLTADNNENRTISELADSVAREQQHGESVTTTDSRSSTKSASGGVSFVLWSAGGQASTSSNHGVATAVSRSSGSRQVAARTSQDIAARTQQLATSARSRQVAVIRETSQSEGEQVATRVVTNYNHMHAMSVQYYEVVQAYEVATRPVLIERCLFIPLKILTFNRNLLKRYAPVLAAAAPGGWANRIANTDLFDTTVVRTRSSSGAAPTPVGTAVAPAVDKLPGKLKDLSAAADGSVWGLDLGGQPVRWDRAGKTWTTVATGLPADGAIGITVGNQNMVWALSSDNLPYRLTGETWVRFGDRAFSSISSGADGSTWATGRDSDTFRLSQDGTSWESLGSDGVDVAVINRNAAWNVDRNDHIWAWNPKRYGWDEKPGLLRQIAGASDGSIWGINAGNDLFRWVGTAAWTHHKYAGVEKFLVAAPVSERELWALAADGTPVHITERALSGFDDHVEDGDAESLTVWWDDDLIRGIKLTTGGAAGTSFRYGDTDPALTLPSQSHTFAPGERLASLLLRVGVTAGGSVRQLVLTTSTGVTTVFGPDPSGPTEEVTLDVRGCELCGLYGDTGTLGSRHFLASLGCWVRGEVASGAILDHLNDNATYYSQVIWANADELAISRILASYRSPDPNDPVPLGVRVDPRPVAVTGNYLAFRWHFGTEEQRQAWLAANHDHGLKPEPPMIIGLPSPGVFAEAVLGRSNAAEKLDLTRFWNWQDSPIPILPPEISPVSTGSRARDIDLTAGDFAPTAAQLTPLRALPNPTGLDATLRALTTANLFRDMSGLAGASQLLSKSLELAATNDQAGAQNATAAMKIATDHFEKMAELAVQAAPMLLGPEGAALSGMLGGGGGGGIGSLLGGAIGGSNLSGLGAALNTTRGTPGILPIDSVFPPIDATIDSGSAR
jgi:hypothetical protein